LIETGLLLASDHEALRQWVLDRAAMLAPSLTGPKDKPGVRSHIRNSLTLPPAELKPWYPLLRERIAERIPAMCAMFGVAPREIGPMEFEAVVYRDGAYYRRHIDTRTNPDPAHRLQPRILSAVYYFHAEPRGFEGGALRLYPALSKEHYLDIDPQANALLVFPSWAPHEVMPVACASDAWVDARLAVNCWIQRAAPEGAEAQ
jgi:predicted 2-oxoglutarate/Fe(II)-dependent dioxygenase YbiX